MMERKSIKIFKIEHSNLREPDHILADNIEEAIEKFKQYYNDDYDVRYCGEIENITLEKNLEVIA